MTQSRSITTTEASLLGLLARRDMSGYDLRKAIDVGVGYFWAPAKSGIYSVLPRLVESGLAEQLDSEPRNRRERHVYRITDRGRSAFERWLEEAPIDDEPGRNVLLLKTFFGALASRQTLLEQLRERRAQARRLQRELQELEAMDCKGEDDAFHHLVRRYGLEHAEAVLRWIDYAEARLDPGGTMGADAGTRSREAS